MSHASNMSRSARKTADEMRDSAQDVKQRVQETAGNVMHNVQRMGAEAAEAAREHFDDFRETASDYMERGKRFEKRMEGQVQAHPVPAVLLAVGFGFLIGLLCTRR